MTNQPSPARLLSWFDPRGRKIGTYAFILNRITALGLTIYLALHLFMLSKLAQGPEAYNDFITLAKTPVIKVGEMLVVAAGIMHGLNGIRIALTSFGIGARYQKQMALIVALLSAVMIAIFGYSMFFGA